MDCSCFFSCGLLQNICIMFCARLMRFCISLIYSHGRPSLATVDDLWTKVTKPGVFVFHKGFHWKDPSKLSWMTVLPLTFRNNQHFPQKMIYIHFRHKSCFFFIRKVRVLPTFPFQIQTKHLFICDSLKKKTKYAFHSRCKCRKRFFKKPACGQKEKNAYHISFIWVFSLKRVLYVLKFRCGHLTDSDD